MFSKSSKCIGRDNGLSLLEVLISMIVLAIGILGLAPMIVLSIEGNDISRDFSIASELAKKQLEEYQSQGVLIPEDEDEDSTYTLSSVADSLSDTLGFERWIRIAPEQYANPARICTVQVVISWTDKMGNPRSTTHSTLMTNN